MDLDPLRAYVNIWVAILVAMVVLLVLGAFWLGYLWGGARVLAAADVWRVLN